jgi:hypothetical protein
MEDVAGMTSKLVITYVLDLLSAQGIPRFLLKTVLVQRSHFNNMTGGSPLL